MEGYIYMPTVLQDGPYSFVFFSSDEREPVHIHVQRDRRIIKFWLAPISLARNRGFSDHEINRITRLVEQHQHRLRAFWYDYFGA